MGGKYMYVSYVHMELLLAAKVEGLVPYLVYPSPVDWSTLTSAPVSNRKFLFEMLSLSHSSPLAWPPVKARNSNPWQRTATPLPPYLRFLTFNCMVVGTVSLHSWFCSVRNKKACYSVSHLSEVFYVELWIPYWYHDIPKCICMLG